MVGLFCYNAGLIRNLRLENVDVQLTLTVTEEAVSYTHLAEVLEASHLHFGMKQDGNWIDPMSKISD